MMKRLFVLFIVVLTAAGFAACRRETEEDRVRKVISSVQKAVEDKKIAAVQEQVSRAYRDPQGNDYEGIKSILAFYFFRHRAVSVSIPALDITVKGDEARAAFQAILAGRDGGDADNKTILPDSLGVYQFDIVLRKEGDAWKAVSATWERLGEGPSSAGH
jgi:hypothetical protein